LCAGLNKSASLSQKASYYDYQPAMAARSFFELIPKRLVKNQAQETTEEEAPL
jgi:hypothetical protein